MRTAALSLFGLAALTAAAATAPIPRPNHVVLGDGSFSLSGATPIQIPARDSGAEAAARYLRSLWMRSNQLTLALSTTAAGAKSASSPAAAIRFERVSNLAPEGYRLDVTPRAITVSATTSTGLFYGAVSLWQLLPPGVSAGSITAQHIDDSPHYAWRGLMLDSSRHLQSPAFIKSMLDWMAWHKLNVFHWHLTDDQGWRLEIRQYPKLTQVGAWRDDRYYGPRYGGYYTQVQVRDIVAFAAARHIEVVPEIDMPGHATAAIAAYPHLGSGLQKLSVSSNWGVHEHLFNVEPATFQFLEGVLDEVMQLFPSHFIHIGGDEAVKNEWNASPQVQARARALGVADSSALQTYFMQHMNHYLELHGRRMIGWDEVLAPGLSRNAVVMSWRGVGGAHAAALAGNDTILSPQPTLYFDRRQSKLATEPPGRLEVSSLRDVYDFETRDAGLSGAEQKHVLGVQANIWTEHIRNEHCVEWMALPRAAALAEVAWSEHSAWSDFIERLPPMFARYRSAGLNYADSQFGIDPRLNRAAANISVALSSSVADIRYTLDGADPTLQSARYRESLTLPEGTELRAATFLQTAAASRPIVLRLDAHSGIRRDSQTLEQCTTGVGLLLEAKDASSALGVNILNPCWIERDVDLTQGPMVIAGVAALPFNYELGADTPKIRAADAHTAYGEFEVHADGCDTPAIAIVPLGAPAGAVTLPATRLPQIAGRHDLCLRFARPALDPLWALDWIEVQ